MINSLAVLLALSVHTARFVWLPNAPEENVTAYHVYDVTPDFIPPGPVALAVRHSQNIQTESHSWTNVVHLGEAGMRALPDTEVASVLSGAYRASADWLTVGSDGEGYGPVGFKYSAQPPAPPSEKDWVTGFTPGTLRNNVGGYRGMLLRTGPNLVTVTALGRVFVSGNTQDHELILVDAAEGTTVSSVVWTPSDGVHNQIKYMDLTSPVTLSANTDYYLGSLERSGGDSWYSYNTAVTTTRAPVDPGNQSPALVYQLNFEHSGTNYVWIRGHAISGGNSVHVHLSGSMAPTAENITFPVGPGWQWSSSVAGGARAYVLVSEPGIHPVEVYMREDGFAFERILFTTNAQADPRTNQTRMATTTDTNATITNLHLTLPRTFAATAENEAGESDLSNTVTITNPVAPPKAPTGFKWAEENR
jgi:hypothetical protein